MVISDPAGSASECTRAGAPQFSFEQVTWGRPRRPVTSKHSSLGCFGVQPQSKRCDDPENRVEAGAAVSRKRLIQALA